MFPPHRPANQFDNKSPGEHRRKISMLTKISSRPLDPLFPVMALGGVLKRIFDRMVNRQDERRAIHTMSTMSDHMLRDLGIGRAEIVRTVRYGRNDLAS